MITGKTAIIAGSGVLPLVVAERLKDRQQEPLIILLKGNANEALKKFQYQEISVVEFSKLLEILHHENVNNIILAGGIINRPRLRDLHFDLPTLKILPKLFLSLFRGDDALLRSFINIMEDYNFHVIGAHEIAPDIVAPQKCVLTRITASPEERINIDLAATAAKNLGKNDVGQGAVAIDSKVIALEDVNGTDALLKRVALHHKGNLSNARSGVLVKMKKPEQELRADLPTIGPDTVENVYKAGLAGIAIEAGSSFILNKDATIAKADQYGLFIETL